jgi:thioredoxin reductase (NADPH)
MGREKAVENYDVIIIGGGPAGLSAAIYAGRARLKTLLLEKALVGGLATYTNEIANYPGFPDNPKGETITDLMKNQAKNLGVTFKLTAVTSVDLKGEEKVVETFRNKFLAKVIIIATGGRPRTTGGKNEENYLFDKGISFCATCDAASNTGKHVVVIGSGDAAIEEGMFLTKFASKVTVSVMHEEGKMDCNEIAKAAALANPKMAFVWNTVVDGFEGDGHLKTVIMRNVKTGELIPVDCDNCFEFIGYLPNSELFENQLPLTRQKYITVNNKMETGIEGVLAVGDITDKYLKQIATAVGDGAVAGTVAERYIAEKNIFDNQVMQKEKPGLIYVYNAIDCDARNFLADVEAIEKSAAGALAVSRIDTYKSNGLALKLELESVPAAVVTKEGKIVQKIYGLNKDAILEALK